VRLQCYEGLDEHAALYEWNYQRQLLAIRLLEHDGRSVEAKEASIFSETYLLKRPLLDSITREQPVVLLIDEVDRADEAFEAYLLELLSDFQLSIPELGTIHARSRPWVVLTSNGTRELSDALRRRCLYHYVEYPSFEKELLIVSPRTSTPRPTTNAFAPVCRVRCRPIAERSLCCGRMSSSSMPGELSGVGRSCGGGPGPWC
jgi:MoxR-like ATPase